jgi:hypothetical protein
MSMNLYNNDRFSLFIGILLAIPFRRETDVIRLKQGVRTCEN